jgi:hypothetical protein
MLFCWLLYAVLFCQSLDLSSFIFSAHGQVTAFVASDHLGVASSSPEKEGKANEIYRGL